MTCSQLRILPYPEWYYSRFNYPIVFHLNRNKAFNLLSESKENPGSSNNSIII